MNKNYLAFWAALFWLSLTTVLLCLPGAAFPKENWFNKIWFDKWVHIGLFAVMVFLWSGAISIVAGKNIRAFVQVALYFLLYGIAMEFVQKYFIPNRSFDAGDIIADAVGDTLGLLISIRIYKKK